VTAGSDSALGGFEAADLGRRRLSAPARGSIDHESRAWKLERDEPAVQSSLAHFVWIVATWAFAGGRWVDPRLQQPEVLERTEEPALEDPLTILPPLFVGLLHEAQPELGEFPQSLGCHPVIADAPYHPEAVGHGGLEGGIVVEPVKAAEVERAEERTHQVGLEGARPLVRRQSGAFLGDEEAPKILADDPISGSEGRAGRIVG